VLCLSSFAFTAGAQSWVQTTSLPDGYTGQSLVYASGFLYQSGGESKMNVEADGTNVFYAAVNINGTIGSWQSATPLPEAVYKHAGVTANGYLYVLGGIHYTPTTGDVISNTVYYAKINSDGSLGSWQTANPLPQAICYLNASVWNNTIYVAGGGTESTPVNTVYSAKVQTGGSLSAWVAQTPLPYATYAQGGIANGMLYLLGGVVTNGEYTNAVFYTQINADGTLAGWNRTTPLPQSRSNFSAVTANGRIFVLGGWNGTSITNSFYITPVAGDGTVGTWVAGTSLPASVDDLGAAVTPSYIFLSGGTGSSSYSSNVYSMSLPAPPVAPTLLAGGFTNGNFQLQLTSTNNTGFGLLASTNLMTWTNVGWGFTDTNGLLHFMDTNASGFPRRFYRAYWPLP
jgi:hypothetical protein